MITLAELDDASATVRGVVEARVRFEHEPEIAAEVERRMAAVEAALDGTVEAPAPAKPPRKPRSDRGRPRNHRAPVHDTGMMP